MTENVKQIAFVLDNLPDYESLLTSMPSGMPVFVLQASGDALAQMATILVDYSGLDAIHLLSHGSDGKLNLGAVQLAGDSLSQHARALAQIGTSLADTGDILVYGCDVAKDQAGLDFVGKLAQATGADIAVSNDPTGSAARGGDWTLEVVSGSIETHTAAFENYSHLLDVITTYSGTLTDDDYYNRPWTPFDIDKEDGDAGSESPADIYSGSEISQTSATPFNYVAATFTPTAGGSFDFYVSAANVSPTSADPSDVFMALYDGSFDAAHPLANLIWVNDDRGEEEVPGVYMPYIGGVSLSAGHNYVVVMTTYDPGSQGSFTFSVEGAVGGTFAGGLPANPPTLSATSSMPIFMEGGVAVDLFSNVTAATNDSGQTFSGFTLSLSDVTDGADEILNIGGVDVTLNSGNVVSLAAGGVATVMGDGNHTATVTISGMTASESDMQALIDGLSYRNESGNPTIHNREVSIDNITDSGTSNASASVRGVGAVVTVSAPSDHAPTVTAEGSAQNFIEGMRGGVDLFHNVIADTNDTGQTFSSAILTVSNVQDDAEYLQMGGENISLTNGNAGTIAGVGDYSISMSGATATLTFTNLSASNAQMSGMLDAARYFNGSDIVTPGDRTITLTNLTDSGSSSNAVSPGLSATVTVDQPNVVEVSTEAELDSAVANATAGTVIRLTDDIELSQSLTGPSQSVTIDGRGHTIDGNGWQGWAITDQNVDFTIENMELKNFANDPTQSAASVIVGFQSGATGGSLTVRNIDAHDNSSLFGIGLFTSFGDVGALKVVIDNSEFHDNVVNDVTGGASILELQEQAGSNDSYDVQISNTAIYNNNSATLDSNGAIDPSGPQNQNATVIEIQSFTNGVNFVSTSSITLTNTTMAGGAYAIGRDYNFGTTGGTVTLNNTVLSDFTGGVYVTRQSGGASGSYTLINHNSVDYNGSFFTAPWNGDYRPRSDDSGLIDQGDAHYLVGVTDARELDRVRQGGADIGAYESEHSAGTAVVIDLNGGTGGTDYSASISTGLSTGVTIADAGALLAATDGDTRLASITVSLSGISDTGHELLHLSAAAEADARDAGIIVSGNDSGTLTVSGGATLEDYQWVLRAILYQNDASSPTLGARTITVTVDDDLSSSAISTITISNPGPAAPDLDSDSDSGSSSIDNVTKNTTPTFTGTADAGSMVTLYDTDGTTVLGTDEADGNGNWSITSSILSEGDHTVTIKTTDTGGNTSAASSGLTVTIDTTAPSTPASPDLDAGSDTGSGDTDNVTNDTTPTFTGTAEIGSTVTLYDTDGTTVLGADEADGSGNWSITSTALSEGSHTLTAKQADIAGNVSTVSNGLTVTIDTTAPSAPGTPHITAGTDTGASSSDGITSNITPTFTGTTEAGSTVTLYDADGTTILGSTQADGSGKWSITSSTLAEGDHTVTVKATDAAGNVSIASAGQLIKIDTTHPDAPGTPDLTVGSDTGSSSTDNLTSSTTPTFTGTAEAGSKVKLYDTDGTTLLGTTTADGNGNWSIIASTLSSGDHTLTVKQTDVAGNVSTASAGLTISIDTAAPSAPGTPVLDSSSDSGSSSTDNLTSDATPTFTGTADAGSTVTLYDTDGTTVLGTDEADGSGNWSITATTLSSGDHTVTAKQSDAAGNVSIISSGLTISIDTSAPSAPGTPDLTAGTDTGSSSADNITSNTTPTVTGTTEAGSTVTLYDTDGTTVIGTDEADGSGNWSITATTLSSGDHTVTVKATDAAGNVSTASTGLTINIDTTAPSAPATPDLAVDSDTGSSSSDNVTSDTTPTVTGTAEAGSNVKLYDTDGTTLLGTAVADSSGNWSITSTALSSGDHTLTVKQTDIAGNVSTVSSGLTISIDTSAPSVPGTPDLDSASDTGSSATDNITSDTTPTFTGTADAGSAVTLYDTDGTTVLGTDEADGNGNWSITSSILSEGDHTVTIKTTDTGGNTSAASSGLTITIDTTAPSAPGTPALGSASDTGASNSDGLTSDATPTFTGTAEAGSAVKLYDTDGTTVIGTAQADGNGHWSITATTLSSGDHTLTVKATDAAGNVSTVSSGLALTIDADAPASFELSADIIGDNATGTNATVGTLSADDAHSITYALVAGDGTNDADNDLFNISGTTLRTDGAMTAGSYHIRLSATDEAGNVSYLDETITVTENHAPTGMVTISGTATQGQTLTAANTLADADGLGAISYQWQADGVAISGATGSTFTLAQDQVGKAITVIASYTDLGGVHEAVTSSGTGAVGNVNDAPTGSVTISGTATQGQTLTAANTLADADGLGTITYKWLADGVDISGANGSTFTLTQGQVGKTITVSASYTDLGGTHEAVTSVATGAVSNINDNPTGNVTISGTAVQGQTLTAANTLTDADGLEAVSYQWQADGVDISGATGSTFTLTQGQVGKMITVSASYTDLGGTHEAVTSVATGAVSNINDNPTGNVTISGTAMQGQTLTAANTLADADGLGTIRYQWQADGVDISGANGSTFTLTQGQVGKTITVSASYTDLGGTHEAVTSVATGAVSNINDNPTGNVTISGTAVQGQTLTAANTLADADGLGTIRYQWQADGVDISGAIGSTFTLTQGQVGKAITVIASYTDLGGAHEAVTSAAIAAVSNVNDNPTGNVTISGTAVQGQTLTAANTLADADGLGAVSYQWQADGVDISGATDSTFTLTQGQVGKTITVIASYTDLGGAHEAVTSAAIAAVSNVNDNPTGNVTISGTAVQGQTLTAANTLADADGLGTIRYQWQADGVDISGATDSTFTLTQGQVGKMITVIASYTDLGGTAESVTSSETETVINADNHNPTGSVSISGTATQGQTLTAANTLADTDGLGTVNYQWLADGVVISGATGSTFTLTQGQVGKAITVIASYTDLGGTQEAVTSSATGTVGNVNDAPTGGVTISGTATQGQTLTAANTLVDADGLGAISYQWQADGVAISGATGSTFTLAQDQVGKAITVIASYTDLGGVHEAVTSSGTGAVGNVNDAPTGSVTISGTATQGQTLTAANTLADADGLGTITYNWQADGVDISGANGSTFTLTQGQVGKTITVAASYTDHGGTQESVTSAATAAVGNVNDAPTLANPIVDQVATEEQPFRFVVPANVFQDADTGTVLSYAATLGDGSALPGWLIFDKATRTFTGTPANDDVGSIVVKVTASDGSQSAFDTFEINVADMSHAPTSADHTVDLDEGETFTFSAADFSFADADGDTLSAIIITTLPASGMLMLNGEEVTSDRVIAAGDIGDLSWIPDADGNGEGPAAFAFAVRDSSGATSTSEYMIHLNVVATNNAPVASDDVAALVEGKSVKVNVLANDTDTDGGRLSVVHADVTSGNGTVTINENGRLSVSYTGADLDAGATATITVNYTATDGHAGDDATLSVTVTGVTEDGDDISGTPRPDTLNGTSAGERIFGLGDSDIIRGRGGNDNISAGAGNDRIDGGGGNDRLGGGSGRDIVRGGAGNDLVSGWGGTDILTGGTGADTFVFHRKDGDDTITDFDAKGRDHDIIDIGEFDSIGTFKDFKTMMTQHGDDVVIELRSRTIITIEHIDIADLAKDHFIF